MDNNWLKHYGRGVPHTLQPYPEHALPDVMDDAARQRPSHPALLFKGACLSYRQVECLSNALAAALVSMGVKKGDRVALVLPNSPQWVVGQLAAWKAGAILPQIQEEAGVTMLVSKWDSETLVKYPSAELVDVTMVLVDACQPTEKQREYAIGIQRREPIPLEEAEKTQDW
jgi:acyl-CoA synthetase (AMP-forming)/AMP-acid ligase II